MARFCCTLLAAVLLGAGLAGHAALADGIHAITLSPAHQRVKPGQRQVVTISFAPSARLYLTAAFPNGRQVQGSIQLDQTGKGRWSFTQPKNTITPASRVGTITAASASDPGQRASARYTIGYDTMDVDGQVSVDAAGAHLEVRAHRARGAIISASSNPRCGLKPDAAVADRSGWATFRCTITTPPPSTTYRITASARVKGRSVTATATVSMPEAAYDSVAIDGLQIFVRQGDTWQPADQIPLNRMVRLAVFYHATESAGIWFPPCVSGTLQVRKGTQALWSGPLVCRSTTSAPDGPPYVYLDASFADPADLGSVDIQAVLQAYPRGDTKTFQKTVVDSPPGTLRSERMVELGRTTPVEQELLDAALELDRVYITARDPDALPSGAPRARYTRGEAARMVGHAEEIVRFCQGRLSQIQP